MELVLVKDTDELKMVWEMQKIAFAERDARFMLPDKYCLSKEGFSKTLERSKVKGTAYYFICKGNAIVGVVCVVDDVPLKELSFLWIMPSYRGKGYSQKALSLIEERYGKSGWFLTTALQDEVCIHVYEKFGYRQVSEPKIFSQKMSGIRMEK